MPPAREARETRLDRRSLLKTTAAGTMVGLAGCSQVLGEGEEYPSEAITIVVPYAEGGGTDGYARIIQDPLSEELGVEVRINNIPGETPVTGLNELVTNPEDSYQLGMAGHLGLVGSALIFADWAPSELTMLGSVGSLAISCYGNAKYDWGGLNDMVERFNSGEFEQVASIGFGTPFHLVSLIARERADWNWEQWVSYEGAAPSVQAVAQDEVPFGVIASVVLRPHYQQDTEIDVIGTFADDGDPTMPEVETWSEAGLTSVNEVSTILMSVFGPPEMPDGHRDTIDEALQAIMETDAIAGAREETGLLIDSFATADELSEQVATLEEEIPETVDLDQYRDQ
jgi:tripartite-type tricarboxylate transporter receptor subunit TctC